MQIAPQKQDAFSGTNWFMGKVMFLGGKTGCTAIAQESQYHRDFISLGQMLHRKKIPLWTVWSVSALLLRK